jgi:hypothetical protein
MKTFSILLSAAALVALTSTTDAQRRLRSEASADTGSNTVSTDFTALSSGSGFTPGNVAAESSFGALDQMGSMGGDNRPSGSMQGGHGGFGGSGHGGMQNVGSGSGFAHGSGSFGGCVGLGLEVEATSVVHGVTKFLSDNKCVEESEGKLEKKSWA